MAMDETLQDFVTEAGELLARVDLQLVDLEKRPSDAALLNEVFRGFHTIKGGAGFLGLTELVDLCHVTENVLDRLRKRELALCASSMDAILAATASVRRIFEDLARGARPTPPDPALLAALRGVLSGEPVSTRRCPAGTSGAAAAEPDWEAFLNALTQTSIPAPARNPDRPYGRRASDDPTLEEAPLGRRATDRVAVSRDPSIRIDTSRLDQVLTLSGELGLAKNRLGCVRQDILSGRRSAEVLREFDEAVNQLDRAIADLQRAVLKTRMQPIGRLFQRYPRVARDLARSLGKDVDLVLEGEDTELDRAVIDELADPLIHLVRNAVDHGIESPDERLAAGKSARSTITLTARQEGDHVTIAIRDDGRGMNPEAIRRKAQEKGIIDSDDANRLDRIQCLHLIFMPGFSTKEQVSSISGRGVGMDVVKTAIEKLSGRIDIDSEIGVGTLFRLTLPLTLAMLPVLVLRHGKQSFGVPLALVHEIVPLDIHQLQHVGGRATLVIRDQVLPVRSLGALLGWTSPQPPRYGVVMQCGQSSFVLGVEDYVGREDVVIKPLTAIRPAGVAGATLGADGSVVLVLDIEPLLRSAPSEPVSAFS